MFRWLFLKDFLVNDFAVCSILQFDTTIVFYVDPTFLTSSGFLWRVSVITGLSCLPLAVVKYAKRKLYPPSYSKLEE